MTKDEGKTATELRDETGSPDDAPGSPDDAPGSPELRSRRKLLQMAVYVPPAVLGTIAVTMGACQVGSCNPQTCSPASCNPSGCPPVFGCPPDGGCGPTNCPPQP